jgi:hypothetical protein
MNDTQAYLTPEKFEELKKELENLKTVRRKEVAESLEYARSLGDLSENAEYQEARDMQAAIEERIIALVCQEKTNVEIAELVHREPCSVNDILRRVYQAHGVKTRAGLSYLEGKRHGAQARWVRCEDGLPAYDTPVAIAFDASSRPAVGWLTLNRGMRQWSWPGDEPTPGEMPLCVIAWCELPERPALA